MTEDNTKNKRLVLEALPSQRTYLPGERISYAGLKVAFDGQDVTDKIDFNVPEDRPWDIEDENVEVIATYTDSDAHSYTASFTLMRKKRKPVVLIAVVVALAAVGCGYLGWNLLQPESDTGSRFVMSDGMSDDEAQAMLDEQTENSRFTVSIAPEMEMRDNGELRINFIVPEPNNGFSERIEIVQNGQVIYDSVVIDPGYRLEWVSAHGASIGSAAATVYAVKDGNDVGNPVSVEVQIVEEK